MRSAYKTLAISRRIMVNLLDGSAIDGILWDEKGALIVLRDAHLHTAGNDAAPLDGETILDRSQIRFVQVVNA